MNPLVRLLSLPATGLLLAALAQAQTTHTVNLFGFDFSPADLTIDAGDTVEWVWISGLHNVESGLVGAHDGAFNSGTVTFPPASFSVTFDAALLDAHPVRGNVYDYYCVIHAGSGMVGTITVNVPATGTLYGSGINPAGSMSIVAGTPSLGGTVTLGVDNPLGTQAVGSVPFLAIASAADPAFPAGTPVPGFGMNGLTGELLISLLPPNPLSPVLAGAPWAGPGNPVAIPIAIPADADLMGRRFYAQGLLFDPLGPPRFGLADAVVLRFGL